MQIKADVSSLKYLIAISLSAATVVYIQVEKLLSVAFRSRHSGNMDFQMHEIYYLVISN